MGEPPPKSPLDYDRTTSVVSVRGFRLLILLTLLNTAMLAWFTVTGSQGPQFVKEQWQHWKLKRRARAEEAALLAAQQQCLTHALPADTVVYTEDPARQDALARDGGGAYRRIQVNNATVPEWDPPLRLTPPPHWVAMGTATLVHAGVSVTKDAATVFLHERATPRGEPRLVAIELYAAQRFDQGSSGVDRVHTFRRLRVSAYAPRTPQAAPKKLHSMQVELRLPKPDIIEVHRAADGTYAVQRAKGLTVFAGQPDPADPTHFTIPYEIDGQQGVIDGWVREENLLIKPRFGLPKFDNGPGWELGTSPTTRPATAPAGVSLGGLAPR